MRKIYAVGYKDTDRDNYPITRGPISDWYLSRDEVQRQCDIANKPLLEALEKKNLYEQRKTEDLAR